MTTPSDLIEEVARAIWCARFDRAVEKWDEYVAWYRGGQHNPSSCVHGSTIAEAMRDARAAASIIIEACAEVACCNYGGFAIDTQYGDGYQRACVNIADAIRALAEKPEGEPDAQICASDDGDEMCDRCDCWKHTRALCG